jgi:hypothetical protein
MPTLYCLQPFLLSGSLVTQPTTPHRKNLQNLLDSPWH